MPYSEKYLTEVAKSDPVLAENMRQGTHRSEYSGLRPHPLSQTREVSEKEIRQLEDFIHGTQMPLSEN